MFSIDLLGEDGHERLVVPDVFFPERDGTVGEEGWLLHPESDQGVP